MQSNTSALPLGNHLPAEAINAGNAFLSRAAAEPARHVTHAERRQGGGHVGGGGTRAAVGGLTPLETALHGQHEARVGGITPAAAQASRALRFRRAQNLAFDPYRDAAPRGLSAQAQVEEER